VETAKRMVEASPALVPLCTFSARTGTLTYRVTGSRMVAHPSKVTAVQGLNFSLAVIDEIGFASDQVVSTLVARLGKRPDAAVIGIGTPGLEPNVMFRLRERGHELDEVGFSYLEWSAPGGCAITDRRAWRQANPALRGGFLRPDALETQAAMLSEHEFRVYHLGQWVQGSTGAWLPAGAWDACPHAGPPPDGSEVVLALAGTWTSSVAVVGASMDGAVFVAWANETATDSELESVLEAASKRWQVVDLVVAPRIRTALVRHLAEGRPVTVWPHRVEIEVASSTEWRRAIVEGRVAHDHHPLLANHVGASVARATSDGSMRLTPPDDGRPVDAARAARMAWWQVTHTEALTEVPAIF